MRLLVVEDEPDLAEAIARGMRRRGHGVDVAETMADAELRLRTAGYDLMLLDWMLPDGAGIDLCRRVTTGEVPTFERAGPRILMLTARDTIEDRVAGLDAGADDYLVKPFAFAELEARVRALLRRDTEQAPVLETRGLVLDPAAFEVRRDGVPLQLTVKEFALLEYFMANAGRVLSQEELLEHVWDEMADPFTNTVRVTISNLRKKLGDPPLIETIAGRGYLVRPEPV